MNQVPTPPCERDLPDRQRRRAELLATLATESDSTRRRVLIPLGTAASVLGLVAGGTFAAQSLSPDTGRASHPDAPEAATAPESDADPDPGPDSGPDEPLAAPPAHDLDPGRQRDLLRKCTVDVPEWQRFEPALGVRFDDSPDPDTGDDQPRMFVIGEDGDDRLYCTFDQDGNPGNSAMFGSSAAKDIPYLFAHVDGKGDGFGMYTRPVAKVTVQREGAGERAAVLRDGYWFLPPEAGDADSPSGGGNLEPGGGNDLIGVPNGYTYRGYDEAGELVYDSTTDGPDAHSCYTDPERTEVVVDNGVEGGNPDVEDCRPTHEWRP